MSRTKQDEDLKLRLEPGYAQQLDAALMERYGSQKAVESATGINQSTVSRVLRGGPSTFHTIASLVEAAGIAQPPLVMSKNMRHAEWCRLGALLLDVAPEQFERAMGNAENSAHLIGIADENWTGDVRISTQPEAIDALKDLIANPHRTDRKRTVRRG